VQPHANDQQPHQSDRDEDLPAQTHDLVIAITREGRSEPEETEEEEGGLEYEPVNAVAQQGANDGASNAPTAAGAGSAGARATGAGSSGAGSADGTASNVKASELLATIVDNYGTYYEMRERLLAWQDWYTKQKHIFETIK
jgi:hypothetical protein